MLFFFCSSQTIKFNDINLLIEGFYCCIVWKQRTKSDGKKTVEKCKGKKVKKEVAEKKWKSCVGEQNACQMR